MNILWISDNGDIPNTTVGNSHAPDEGIRLVQAAVARLNAERCLEVLWVSGHCGLMGNELADEESRLGSAEHQPSVTLDPATSRALIRRACASAFNFTPPPTKEVYFSKKMSCCPSPKRPTSAAPIADTKPHYDADRT